MPFLHKKNTFVPKFILAEGPTFKTGLKHACFTPWGDRYKGEWVHNLKSGKGTELLVDGVQYEGDWLLDVPDGWGVESKYVPIEKRFKLIYTGSHKGPGKGRYHGFGYKHYDDGGYYEGQFQNKKRDGYGKCWYPNKSYYEGYWKKDLYHGFGMFVQGNGNRYSGEWKKGVKHGWGQFLHLDSGQVQDGEWEEGICVSSLMQDLYYRQSAVDPTHYPIIPAELCPDTEFYADLEAKLALSRGEVPKDYVASQFKLQPQDCWCTL